MISDVELKVVVSGGELMVEMRGHVYPIDTIIEPPPPDSTAGESLSLLLTYGCEI